MDKEVRMERLLTLTEVANWLRVPTSRLYQWRYRGEGPKSVKVGASVRYRREDVDRWIENNRKA